MKRLFVIFISLAMLLSVFACEQEIGNTKVNEDVRVTDEPVVTQVPDTTEAPRDVTFSEYRYPKSDVEAPDGYFLISAEAEPYMLYVFSGENGVQEWRVFAERDKLENGEVVETQSGYLAASVGSAVIRLEGEPSYVVEPNEDRGFVAYEEEVFGEAVFKTNTEDAYTVEGTKYGTYAPVDAKEEEVVYSYLYPAMDGVLQKGALPVSLNEKGEIRYIVPGGDSVLLAVGKVENRS